MKKSLLAGILLFLSVLGKAQFTTNDLVYYVGDGPDTAILVIDFLDETVDETYAWGFLFDATMDVTGGDMLDAIQEDEANLTVELMSGFLNNIYFNSHIGEGGDPNFWGTWSKTDESEWELNDGLSEILNNGDWFGCSYTDFDPAVAPGEPLPAYASKWFNTDEIVFTVGTGNDTAVLVVDFVSGLMGEAVSYAWAYAFDGTTTGTEMMNDIADADINLSVSADAFLNDIIYNGLEGIGGDPYYWATWSGTNLSDWTMNAGLGTVVNPGDWFGCSYADWEPRRPWAPITSIAAEAFTAVELMELAGEGDNQVILVIDFNEREEGGSYAYSYRFDTETVLASDVLTALEDIEIFGLDFDLTGGFLNAVSCIPYDEEAAGGDPNYWSTWSGTNAGDWVMNSGIGEELSAGDWFACSYTAWSPATPPSIPTPGLYLSNIAEESFEYSIYPNPTAGIAYIELDACESVRVYDLSGKLLLEKSDQKNVVTLDLSAYETGIYLVEVVKNGKVYPSKIQHVK